MRRIVIDNFRSFKNQEFNFSKVNILIGENSAGKSSLLKFILALKQTVIQKNSNLVLYGDYVDLGNYREVIYYNKTHERLRFEFEFGLEYSNFFFDFLLFPLKDESSEGKIAFINQIKTLLDQSVNSPSSIKFSLDEDLEKHSSIEIEFYNKEIGTLTIKHLIPVKQEAIDMIVGASPLCQLVLKTPEGKEIFFDNIEYQADGFTSRVVSASLRKACREFGDNDSSLFYKIAYLLILQNYLVDKLTKVRFINPFHASPERFYSLRDKSSYINMNIEKLINFLGDKNLAAEQKKKFINSIGEALKSFGLAEDIQILSDEKIAVHELRAKIKDLWSNITDVGYGVALQLPILFQTIISEAFGGQIILIEQPEVHLHPKMQANFIETILKIGPSNTYFIETHSEHIVRKLQSITKSNAIKREDVSIHYFTRENEKSLITRHFIDENWRLTPNLPSGFFDSSYLLAKELL